MPPKASLANSRRPALIAAAFACAIFGAMLAAAASEAKAEVEAEDGFHLRRIAMGTDIEDERLRSKDGSQPRQLLGMYPYLQADAHYDELFYFGGKAGPRKLTGQVGDGAAALKGDAYGYRVSGYGAYMALPGLLFGLGVAYQLDSGELSNAFAVLNAELSGYEIRPQVLAIIPYKGFEFEFSAAAIFTDANLAVDGAADERFKTHEAETGFEVLAPLTDGIDVMLGVEGRYTWREDVVLGGQRRDKYSALFEAGLDFAMPSDITMQFRFETRPLDSVANDKIYTFKLVKNF